MSVITRTFGVLDQIIFVASIAIGAFVGIYFAYLAPKESHQEADYLFGGRKMKTVPIALSLVASCISGVAMIGFPSEVYVYGMQCVYSKLPYWIVIYFYNTQILPVFHAFQGLSLNEYFEKRYDKRLRLLVSTLYFLSSVSYLPMLMYVPALVYEQVTGYNKYLVTPLVCIVCIFYTSIGGLKAVVWNDAIQMMAIMATLLLIVVKGTYDIGATTIWERNLATTRIEPPYTDFDPTIRQTLLSLLVSGFFLTLKRVCLNQGQIQRHQSVPTLAHAKRAVWLTSVLQIAIELMCMYIGLIVAAFYFSCDPITLKIVSVKDQIGPLYVMQTIGQIPGMTGIFLSGVFSASLSTLSTVLNTLSGVFVEDWIRGYTSWNPTQCQATWTMRIFVVVIGIVAVGLVFVVAKLGMLMQMVVSVDAIFTGATLTVFFTALFFPWVSSLGALVGAITAILSIAPITIGAQYSNSKGLLHFPAKPVSVEGCTKMFNVSADLVRSVQPSWETLQPYGPTRGDNVWYAFRISHLYYFPFSLACGLLGAFLVTIFISKTDLRKVDRRLVAPIATRWLPKSRMNRDESQQQRRGRRPTVTNGEEAQVMLPIELQVYGQH